MKGVPIANTEGAGEAVCEVELASEVLDIANDADEGVFDITRDIAADLVDDVSWVRDFVDDAGRDVARDNASDIARNGGRYVA